MQLRHLPNVISLIRLCTVPVLAWLAYNQAQQAFAWLILAAGLTDILDGWIARKFGWTSALGALLDSISDVSLILVAIYGIWMMQRHVFTDQWMVFAAVSGIWSVVHITALLRYGRLASFHTRFTQLGIFLFGIFVLVLLFHDFVPLYFHISAGICFLGGVESLVMIALIPEWTPDLRAGLPAAIRKRREL
jgi:CDP-diacylglycerol--glycerol-3-phosphate 3-phosphatidyltransferase